MKKTQLVDSPVVPLDAVRSRALRVEVLLPAIAALAVGLVALGTGDMPMRWFVVGLGATFALPFFLVFRQAYALQLGAILFSLQAYMCLTLLPGDGSGADARGLEIHLTTLLCIAALMMRWSDIAQRGLRLRGLMVQPFVIVMITLVISTFLNRERKAGAILMFGQLQYFFAYLAVMNLVTDRRYASTALGSILLMVCTQASVYFVQYLTKTTFTLMGDVVDHSSAMLQRHGGLVSTHVSGFAEFMNVVTLVSVGLYLAAPSALWRRRAAAAAVLGTAAVLLTLTRAAWLGFVLGTIVMVVTAVRRGWLSTAAINTMAAAGLLMVVLFIQPISGVLNKEHDSDFEERAMLQRMALMVIEAKPFVGVGPGAYQMEFRYYATDWSFKDKWAFAVHNHYMLRAAEAGIPGLLAMVWLFSRGWMLAWNSLRLRSPVTSRLGLGLIAGMVAVGFQFNADIGDASAVHFTMWSLLGLLEALRRLEEQGIVVDFEDHPSI
jgi:O-Antigen ligase